MAASGHLEWCQTIVGRLIRIQFSPGSFRRKFTALDLDLLMAVIDVIDRRIPRLPRSEATTGTAAAASRTVQATAPQPAHAQPQSFTPNPQRIEHRTGAQQPDRWA